MTFLKTWRKYIQVLLLVILRWRNNEWIFCCFSFPHFLSWVLKGWANPKPYVKNKGTTPGLGSGVVSTLLTFPSLNQDFFSLGQEAFSSVEFLRQAPWITITWGQDRSHRRCQQKSHQLVLSSQYVWSPCYSFGVQSTCYRHLGSEWIHKVGWT